MAERLDCGCLKHRHGKRTLCKHHKSEGAMAIAMDPQKQLKWCLRKLDDIESELHAQIGILSGVRFELRKLVDHKERQIDK